MTPDSSSLLERTLSNINTSPQQASRNQIEANGEPMDLPANSSSLHESTLSTFNISAQQMSSKQAEEKEIKSCTGYTADDPEDEVYQPMPESIPESPIALSTSFNSLRVSGRHGSLRMLEKAQKEEKIHAEKAALEAAEKARKEQEEAEEAARKEKEVEEERIEQGLRRIPRKMFIQPLDAKWGDKVKKVIGTMNPSA